LRLRGALAFALPLAIYVASAYHNVMYWDIGEMDTVPYILGIAHPPGFPLYTLLGWAFTHLVPFGSVAFRMSLLSALAIAGVCWFIFRMAGLAAALLFAFGMDAWTHATRAEAHALVALAFVALLFYLLRWLRRGDTRDLYASALVLGLGIAIHPIVATAILGVLAAVVARAHETDPRVLRIATVVAVVSGVVWFAYLPLRSAYVNAQHLDPAAALGISDGAFWNYGDPVILENLDALVTGRDVGVDGVRYGFTADAYTQGVVNFVQLAVVELTPIGVVLAIAGLIVMFRRDLSAAIVACATMVPSALFGFGFGAESDVGRYFLPIFALFAIAAGMALSVLRDSLRSRLRMTGTLAVAVAIVYLLITQRHFFDQPHDDRAARDAAEIVAATPHDAILVATWVIAPPLAYDSYVLHQTGDRTIVASWYGDQIDRLPQWIVTHPVYVAGSPQGSVPGYRLERMPTHAELYRVERAITP
jgi:4-amino-4-deoxy-L-arabinose transferase-like glycosyltransferase